MGENIRTEILTEALDLINPGGDRAKAYGSAQENFTCIAEMWSAYLSPHKVTPRDVANLMALLKLARMRQSAGGHRDSSLDAAAYCALAHELDQTT